MISKLNVLIRDVTASMDGYDTTLTCRLLLAFITDLSTWYLRRSRDRIQKDENCQRVFGWVLITLTKLMAPVTPFITERMYQNLTDTGESVHIQMWPIVDEEMVDLSLDEHMIFVRTVAELGNAKRKELSIPIRQPLSKVTVHTPFTNIEKEWIDVFLEELNIKVGVLEKADTDTSVELDTVITPELKVEGDMRKLVREIQMLRKEKGCRIDEHITLILSLEHKASLEALVKEIQKETLADSITWADHTDIVTNAQNPI
jgi:isoleucyl-tRNA synthetase